jgi:peptidyl-prolyl cis-trans isomerase B (cyclophilin B)
MDPRSPGPDPAEETVALPATGGEATEGEGAKTEDTEGDTEAVEAEETVALAPPGDQPPDDQPPDDEPAAAGGPTKARRRALMLGVIAAIVLLSLIVGAATFGLSRGNHGHPAQAGGAGISGARTTVADANGCHWWAADPATKGTQRNVGAPPPSAAKRVGHRTMTLSTDRGSITVTMDANRTPCTVASFTHLGIRHFYDNTACHRLVTDGIYILQCGDPSGTGRGGPTYVFADELSHAAPLPSAAGQKGLVTYPRGTVALANFGKNTNGSQFFIVYKDSPIPPGYTLFGTVSAGLDVVDTVAAGGDDGAFAPDPGGGHPKLPITIKSLTVD